MLESHGYTVGIISQPDWHDAEAFRALGRPKLGFLISSGNMDSMVNHYTSAKKRRSEDAYTEGGVAGRRPDRAVIVYSNRCREAYKNVPVIIGGIEASLRRFAHYDYWDDKVRRSVLCDSGADLLLYGMGERSVVEVADALSGGLDIKDITYIAGSCYMTSSLERVYDYELIESYEDVAAVDHYPYALDETKAGSASVYAMARSYKQRDFWLLETLCGGGHGNWAYQGMPMGTPGTFRQNMAFAYASGAELVTAFKYSVFPSGFENLGSALIDLNRIPGRRYEEFCQAGQDLAACEPILNRTKVVSEVAVVLDYNSLWANRIKPIHKEFTYEGYAQQLVGQLAALGVNVDLIGTDHPLDGYRLVLVPFAPILPEDFRRKCRDYAEKGGHLLAMTMAFSRDEWGSGIFEKSPVGMTDFFGMHVVEMEPVFDGQTDAPVRIGELTIRSHFWQETLESEGAEVLGVFRGTYRDGWPVLTEHPYGKGSALYLGTAPAPEDAPALLRWLLERCGVSLPPVEMAYGLSVVTRFSETERYIFVFNSLPREQVCRLTRSLEADYGIGEVRGQTLRLPAKGFQILHERREG